MTSHGEFGDHSTASEFARPSIDSAFAHRPIPSELADHSMPRAFAHHLSLQVFAAPAAPAAPASARLTADPAGRPLGGSADARDPGPCDRGAPVPANNAGADAAAPRRWTRADRDAAKCRLLQ